MRVALFSLRGYPVLSRSGAGDTGERRPIVEEQKTEEAIQMPPGVDGIRNIRVLFGILLLVIGVCMSLWVFFQVYRVFTHPEAVEVLQHLIPFGQESRQIEVEGHPVVLPEALFVFLSYSAGCLLLGIGAVLSGAMIAGGASLLPGGIRRFEAGTERRIEHIDRKMKAILEVLRKREP